MNEPSIKKLPCPEFLRISFYDQKDEVMRTLPTINLHNLRNVKNLYKTLDCIVDEGRLTPEERDSVIKTYSNFS